MSKKNAPLEVEVAVITDAAKVADAAEQPTQAPEVAGTPEDEPEAVYVVAVYGELRHLFTNVVFTKDPKKITIDGFLQAQLDAGKLQVVTP